MRVLVLGGAGMLGHKVQQVLCARDHEVTITTRTPAERYRALGVFDGVRHLDRVHANDLGTLRAVVEQVRPEAVVNCIGIVKQLREATLPIPSISLNALLPHQLHELCLGAGARLVHISTDCVFRGDRGGRSEEDEPDAPDLYGRTKALGEVVGEQAVTLRTSIVGRELAGTSGLLEWFLAQPGPEVAGYARAVFSGLPTLALSEVVARLLEDHPGLSGLWHVGAEPIDKLSLLQLARDAYGHQVSLRPEGRLVIDRSLDSSRFRAATGWFPPSWPELVYQMSADPTPYERWRRRLL